MTDGAVVVGVSAGSPGLDAADQLIHELVARCGLAEDDVLACTHLIRSGTPHVAVSLGVSDGGMIGDVTAFARQRGWAVVAGVTRFGPAELVDAAGAAAELHANRRGGRAVVYPGVGRLTGVVTVGEVLADTAVARVTVLAGGDADVDQRLQTRDFVRPEWRDGVLTLVTTWIAGGLLAPFEVPNPTPCCADHA